MGQYDSRISVRLNKAKNTLHQSWFSQHEARWSKKPFMRCEYAKTILTAYFSKMMTIQSYQ